MKTKEVADVLGTTPNVITENGKRLFPGKEIQAGKAVDWTDEEVTILIDHMQKNPSNNAGKELISSTYRSGLTTKLTPALKIQQAMLLMKEGYDEEVARLKKIQAQLLKNGFNRGNASTKEGVVEGQALNAFKGGLSLQVIMQSGNVEACKELYRRVKKINDVAVLHRCFQ